MIDTYIARLVQYGLNKGLICEEEKMYSVNLLLEALKKEDYSDPEIAADEEIDLVDTLDKLMDYAVAEGIMEMDSITMRDLFDTKLMNCIMPRPSQVIADFRKTYEKGPVEATDAYYNFSINSNYIRKDRIAKDKKWQVPSPYGDIDITINLSKPEKDPKAIAAAKLMKQSAYPKCQLCMENEGYAGRLNHPGRMNHRIIPITVNDSKWGFQYSPYVYYNEHCIVFNSQHVPMKIERATFRKLFDFVKQFPHYFLGSNADLPIVGGSILTHDHFQGGHYTFAMETAPVEKSFTVKGFEDVSCGIVKWPLSVIRLNGESDDRIIELADHILKSWRAYTDEAAFVFAETDGEPHNTITPIARMRDGRYELDLALRNNITTEEHPLGLYHPHEKRHHIKKENIGLIEVMGLAVLPSRLKGEMELMKEYILAGKDFAENEELIKHAEWFNGFKDKYNFTEENTEEILQAEVGNVFIQVLEDAGVYKCTEEGREAFARFINTL